LNQKEVTILIPNYKTPDITKICLRLIRQHTDFNRIEVIVIDNNSNDESLAYLKTLPWITLIERKGISGESAPLSHSRALDLALESVTTPYVLSIHTDTFIKRSDWLDVLLTPFNKNTKLAGVGSWKLESKSRIEMFGYHFEQAWKKFLNQYFGYQGYRADRLDVNARYLRSHCAMYRMDVIHQLNTNFSDDDQTAGKVMHQRMVQAGYDMMFLNSAELGKYIDHLNHATMVLNPELGSSSKVQKEGHARIKNKLRGIDATAILANQQLDH
jgi:glycosyltransferase involved in cell wall biosynthesis